jgi:hypothetical protein
VYAKRLFFFLGKFCLNCFHICSDCWVVVMAIPSFGLSKWPFRGTPLVQMQKPWGKLAGGRSIRGGRVQTSVRV